MFGFRKSIKVCVALLIVLAILAATGCAKQAETPKPKEAKAEKREPVTIKVWAPKDWETINAVKKAEEDFAKKYPYITVVRESFEDPATSKAKFIAAIKAGNAPDVGVLNLWWVKDFAMNGWIVPLDKRVGKKTKDDILPPFIDAASYKGKLYGLFSGTDCAVVVYRTDMFKKAGIKPPKSGESWTLEQFVSNAEELTKPGVWGLGVNAKREGPTTYTQLPFFWMYGGDLLDKKGKPSFDSEAAAKSFQLYADFINKYKITPKEAYSYSWDDVVRGFVAGQYAMALMGSWHPTKLEQQGLKGKIGVMQYPVLKKGQRPITIHGGWPMAILTKDSQKQDAAWKYISYMFSEKVQAAMTKEKGNLPVRESIYKRDKFFKTSQVKVYYEQLKTAKRKPGDPIYLIVQDEYTIALDEVLMGLKSPRQALDDAERNVEAKAKAAGLWKW